jgi:predicted N-acyltransferase
VKQVAGSARGRQGSGRVRFLEGIGSIDAAAWNRLAGTSQPFLRHEFLLALEESGCASARRGWTPRHLILEDATGRAIGAMPLYQKDHSRGEFVFDFAWANAYAHHGLPYYPKLVSAIPFTPAGGPRLLIDADTDTGEAAAALCAAGAGYAREAGMSSWHVLFVQDRDADLLRSAGLIERRDCQFHWFNRDYDSFEAFLSTFTAEKRKKARRERRRVAEAGIEFDTYLGADVPEGLWRTLYEFYADTFYRHGHEPYLNLDFFRRIAAGSPDMLMLKVARHGRQPIAVAIFFVGEDALYGRYWGAGGNYHSLHFETCYYQGIEFCIDRGLARFEPGTQGEHKVPRGFVPVITRSAHDIVDPRFADAIRAYAAREARGVDQYAQAISEHVPYHRAADAELLL